MSLGLSWPFSFLLKRLFTITINYSRTERMMRREGYNNSGIAIFSMHDSHVSHYSFLTVVTQSYIKI